MTWYKKEKILATLEKLCLGVIFSQFFKTIIWRPDNVGSFKNTFLVLVRVFNWFTQQKAGDAGFLYSGKDVKVCMMCTKQSMLINTLLPDWAIIWTTSNVSAGFGSGDFAQIQLRFRFSQFVGSGFWIQGLRYAEGNKIRSSWEVGSGAGQSQTGSWTLLRRTSLFFF